ncbi:MAG: sulfite exporter TauE/SafE family protein [Anaerolineae bacterium]|nr:sulfite exporter TauE/SafE family protein [Anaerolineae bacterium]
MDSEMTMFVAALAVGFVAQLIDGAIGMAYGVTSNAFLMSVGMPPALASASVHAAKIFTGAASGVAHWRLGNVNRELFQRLLIPGILGGVIGAYILTEAPASLIKPLVAVYLLLTGARIVHKALRPANPGAATPPLASLGLAGGFLDAIGGGGWGPVVTSTLVANGHTPRYAIGSANLAEFFVALAQSVTFFLTLGALLADHLLVVAALILGGLPAAPLAAVISRSLSPRKLMLFVGCLIMLLSLGTIVLALSG